MGTISLVILSLVAAVFGYFHWQDRRVKKPPSKTWQHCPLCSSPLKMGDADGKQRLKCTRADCHFVHWDNPRPVSVVLIPTTDGGIVLVKRGVPPRIGMFALPGGYVDTGETPDVAAKREAREETGIDVEIERLIHWVVPPGANEILFFFLARPTAQAPSKGSDAAEASIFSGDNIPAEIAFPTHRQVIEDWLRAA